MIFSGDEKTAVEMEKQNDKLYFPIVALSLGSIRKNVLLFIMNIYFLFISALSLPPQKGLISWTFCLTRHSKAEKESLENYAA